VREPYIDEGWLKKLLERNLRPVSAPDELWDRIQQPRVRQTHSGFAPLAVLAVATLAAVAVWGFYPRSAQSTQELAVAGLSSSPETLELQSGTLPEIRAWVKTRTGLDLPLPSEASHAVRLKGVCTVRGGATVEVAYRVSGHNAALLVSKASPEIAGDGRHRFLKCESTVGARVSTWVMRGQLYTLAYAASGDIRDECLLCHAVAGPLTLPN
jgi:hypothetical protein